MRITFVGAGSTIFALTLLKDICANPSIKDTEVVLYDIDRTRLDTTQVMAQKMFAQVGRGLRVRATQNRMEALRNAHFVIIMFQIGGYDPATITDFEIPKKYGLRQTIGDTLGIGGIMRGLRTIPVLLEVCEDMQKVCPNALLINYANPMAINCWAVAHTAVNYVGLCHSIPITTEQLATDLGLPPAEIDYLVAGINHLAFYLTLTHRGKDLYPLLRQYMQSSRFPPLRPTLGKDMVDHLRYELMHRTGYFVTESSEHLSEYVPWFIKKNYPALIERFGIPLDEYPRRCQYQINEWKKLPATLDNELEIAPSNDYGIQIIDAMANNTPRKVYGNIRNTSITNLPRNAIVEVPCLVDGGGIHPTYVGDLPPQLAGLMQNHISVHELTARAILEHRPEYVYHAAMLDPHTAAELSLDDIYAMVDELLAAHSQFLTF